jgi:uncharacterized delta-60 repeat protein
MLNQRVCSSLRTIALACASLLALDAQAGPGALDPTFTAWVNGGAVYATAVQPDGRILLGGAFTSVNNSSSRSHFGRLFADGSLDTTFFNTGSGVSGNVWCLTVQTDGRIVIGGDFTSVNGTTRNRVVRLNANGTVDASFAPTNNFSSSVLAVAAQSDNKVIVGGSFYGYSPAYGARLNADGTVDSSFTAVLYGGAVNAIAIQSDGNIVIGGAFSQVNGASCYALARLNADGSLDNTFQYGLSSAYSPVRCLQIQTDGKILIGGDFTSVKNMTRPYLARLNSNGTLDTGFVSSPGANSSVYAIAVQPDNSVVVGGSFTSYASYSLSHVARLYADGTRDTTFTTSGINNLVQALAVQSDDRLLIGGTFTTINNSNIWYFGRLYGDLYPPEFITQPISRNTNVGASVTFSAMVSNPTPSYYQWRKEGLDIPGATDTSYYLGNVQFADAGNYSVFVSNGEGGITSSNAVLNVGILPAITSQPASLIVTQGQSATFSVTATGTPLNYFWKKNGVFMPGATNASYSIASVAAGNAGTYSCQVSNFLGSVASANATLTVYSPPAIMVPPLSQTVGISSNFTLSVFATGVPAPAYQWFKDGTSLPGATAFSWTVSNAQSSDAGGYCVVLTNVVGSVTSSLANISVQYFAPSIVAQPAGQVVLVSSNFTLTVGASGSAPLACQWRKDGADLPGAGATSYTVTGAQTNDSGAYTVVVTNFQGGVTSAVACINVGYAPLILQQPLSFTNNLGTSNAFSVSVFGSDPLLYQWFKDGTAIADATNSLLPLPNLQSNQVGYYSITVTNLYGWTISSNALLSVPGLPPPFLWEGLLAYYPFNGDANDASGNGNNGTPLNTQFTIDRFGAANAALAFNGIKTSSGSMLLLTNPLFNLGQDYTVNFWFKANTLPQQCGLFNGLNTGSGIGMGFDNNAPGYIVCNIGPGNAYWTEVYHHGLKQDYQAGQWYSLSLTKSGSVYSIYIDGLLEDVQTISAAAGYDFSFEPLIGAYDQAGDDVFNGAIDDVRIYDRALSSAEVQQLYVFESPSQVVVRLDARLTTEGVRLSFPAAANCSYSVLFATNMTSGPWQKLADVAAQATNATVQVTDSPTSPQRFYRVVTPPLP